MFSLLIVEIAILIVKNKNSLAGQAGNSGGLRSDFLGRNLECIYRNCLFRSGHRAFSFKSAVAR
jgi:hypothetical protein